MIKSKTCDILNIDCFGNLSIVTRAILSPLQSVQKNRFPSSQIHVKEVVEEVLNIIQVTINCPNVHNSIKNSLEMPVKKILEVIKNSKSYNISE